MRNYSLVNISGPAYDIIGFEAVMSMTVDFDKYIDKLKEKDNEAFAFVYENTKKGVFSIIVSIVKSRAETEDLMQDTYIKMLKNINSYTKGRNFNAWLMQIAKNIAIDHYRKHNRITVFDPQEQMYVFNNQQAPQKTDLDIHEVIKILTPEEKEIVLLRIVAENKFKDIAKIVDKPLGTVLWIYNKAIKKVQTDFGKEE